MSKNLSLKKIKVVDFNDKLIDLNISYIRNIIINSCKNLNNVSSDKILNETLKNIFEGISLKDIIDKALIMSSKIFIENEPNYSYVTSRLLLNSLGNEVFNHFKLKTRFSYKKLDQMYPFIFDKFIKYGIKIKRLDKRLENFNIEKIGRSIKPERDFKFSYLGLQTLYDRYFLTKNKICYELPQIFFMRVAMGLAINEKEKEKWAIKFYNLLSKFDYMSSTPTLFHSGTTKPQLSSCFLTTLPDSLYGIFDSLRDNALLSKFAGGLGNDWTPVRAMGSNIKGTNGKSSGVIPFLNIADATSIAVNQGGKRKGASCAYLEVWHLDIEDFLELRKNTGDDRRRTHDMNTAVWIPDLFMQRVINKKDWILFSPDDTPDLHDLYGKNFEKKYLEYEEKVVKKKIKNYKKISSVNLWRKILSMLFETGHPWITFKDVCNLRSPQQHCGVIHSSNLCTEITLNTSKDEVAVCNLGSINLPRHIKDNKIDKEKLKKTISVAIRMLDNVIDYNFYPINKSKKSNLKHRPIGLGIMGFQDSLYKLKISYSSKEAIDFSDESMELISYYAINSSVDLAIERGRYSSFKNSLWDKGILPIDSISFIRNSRSKKNFLQNKDTKLNWKKLKEKISKNGIRNSNILAIAPTATISNICGISQSIEPTYQNLYVKSNLSGEFTIINKYLVKDLKKLNLWDSSMVHDLKYFNGSIKKIDKIPSYLKEIYQTSFEISPKILIKAASRRQKWIDQSQSLNIYISNPSGKELDDIYKYAWRMGLKTTYYLRSLGATTTEKSTINSTSGLNSVSIKKNNYCNIENDICDSCQ